MKVAVRNLAGAPRGPGVSEQAAIWENLLATTADVLLLQEVRGLNDPSTLPEGWRAHPAHAAQGWGSMVAIADGAADLEWRPSHPVLDGFGSYLDFARVPLDDSEIVVVSVHAPTGWNDLWGATGHEGDPPNGSRRPWPSDEILDALLEVIPGQQAILAGDWNEAINWPKPGDSGTEAWFERTQGAGLVEVVSLAFEGPMRTNFTAIAKRSYQNDHFFVTSSLVGRVSSVAIWNEPPPRCSDHAGLLVTLE